METQDSKAILSKLQLLLKFIELDMTACKGTGLSLKRRSWIFKLTSIIISSLITITLGLTLNTSQSFLGFNIGMLVKNIAVILSAILTGVTAWEAFGNFQTRYSQESAMINKLSVLYKNILLYTEKNESCAYDKYIEFKRNYEAIQEEYVQERASSTEEEKTEPETKDAK